jgi:ABC-2 type transport system permease protein
LGQDHVVQHVDLSTGLVPGEVDLLLVLAPEQFTSAEVFAVDQFVMQGGTVVLAASPYTLDFGQELSVRPQKTGLEDWLAHHGIHIDQSFVLDSQNSPFPVPVERNLNGFTVRETHLVNYPYFVDIRAEGMHQESGLTSGLQQVTMNWSSPIIIDQEKNQHRRITPLLESSAKSWRSRSTEIQPNFRLHGELGFPVEEEQAAQLLGVMVEGSLTSFFVEKPSPLLQRMEAADEDEQRPLIIRQLEKSPDSARLILFSSSTFLSDTILGISSSVLRTSYLEPIQLLANVVDWSLEDRGLLSLRGRSHFSRSLSPISTQEQLFVEYINYGLAFLGLFVLWLLRQHFRQQQHRQQLEILQGLGRSAS